MVREALTLEWLNAMDDDEAAAYFVARKAEGLTESEQTLLEAWLDDRQDRRGRLQRAEHSWDLFGEIDDDEILAALREHARSYRSPRRWRTAASLAASVAVLLLAATFFLLPSIQGPAGNRDALESYSHNMRYAALPKTIKAFSLPDGSRLTLDAGSVVTARFTSSERFLRLERGRAFFAVSPNPSRPFIVAADAYQATAIGTEFDVSNSAGVYTVRLFDGRLRVSADSGAFRPIFLHAGQKVTVENRSVRIGDLTNGREPAVGWQNGMIVFDGEPLNEAVNVVNKYSELQIVLRDDKIKSLRVSGQFRPGEADRFARTIAELYGLRVARSKIGIELRGH